MRFRRTVARKLWFPYKGWGAGRFGRGVVLPPPRLVQLGRLAWCRLRGHDWGRWRVEDEHWFHLVDQPEPYAMRGCKRHCGTIERVVS